VNSRPVNNPLVNPLVNNPLVNNPLQNQPDREQRTAGRVRPQSPHEAAAQPVRARA
jgi:hypothetical protein